MVPCLSREEEGTEKAESSVHGVAHGSGVVAHEASASVENVDKETFHLSLGGTRVGLSLRSESIS